MWAVQKIKNLSSKYERKCGVKTNNHGLVVQRTQSSAGRDRLTAWSTPNFQTKAKDQSLCEVKGGQLGSVNLSERSQAGIELQR